MPKVSTVLPTHLAEILALYDNSLAQGGVVPREELGDPYSPDHRLGHCRFLVDRLLSATKVPPAVHVAHDFGMIQGILLAERMFSAPALSAHAEHVHLISLPG